MENEPEYSLWNQGGEGVAKEQRFQKKVGTEEQVDEETSVCLQVVGVLLVGPLHHKYNLAVLTLFHLPLTQMAAMLLVVLYA